MLQLLEILPVPTTHDSYIRLKQLFCTQFPDLISNREFVPNYSKYFQVIQYRIETLSD